MTLDVLNSCLAGDAGSFCVSYGFVLASLLLGAVAGFLGGLLGVGGGIVIVPVLFHLFSYSQGAQSLATALALKMAIATSLATIIFTSISAIKAQLPHQSIQWPIVKTWTPFILLGSFSTGFVAQYLSPEWLKTTIGCFLLLAGIVMLLRLQPKPNRTLPGLLGTSILSGFIGFISALAGIGGGNIIVPTLTWFNIPMKNTTATSSTLGLPIALFGSAGFVTSGYGMTELPSFSLGYVYLPALFSIAIMTFLFAPLGVSVAHKVPSARLKQIFGLLLLLVAIKMLM